LQTAVFDPLWRISQNPGVNVERRTDTDHQMSSEPPNVLSHEPFLFWSTEADPNNVRPAVIDLRHQLLFFRRSQRPKRWSVGPNNVDGGDENFKPGPQLLCDPALSAVEEMTPIASRRHPAQLQHEVRTIHAAHRRMSLQTTHPHRRHPVREAEERAVQNVPQSRVALRFHNSVNPSDADVALPPLLEEAVRKPQGLRHVDRADADSENVGQRQFGIAKRAHKPAPRKGD